MSTYSCMHAHCMIHCPITHVCLRYPCAWRVPLVRAVRARCGAPPVRARLHTTHPFVFMVHLFARRAAYHWIRCVSVLMAGHKRHLLFRVPHVAYHHAPPHLAVFSGLQPPRSAYEDAPWIGRLRHIIPRARRCLRARAVHRRCVYSSPSLCLWFFYVADGAYGAQRGLLRPPYSRARGRRRVRPTQPCVEHLRHSPPRLPRSARP